MKTSEKQFRCVLLSSLLAFSLTLLTAGASFAQMAYTRTSFTGAYTPISTGGGATALTFSSNDDGTTSIPLPFNFTYAGTGYLASTNYLAVCTNGFAFFSTTSVTTPTSAGNTNLYTTSTPNNTLAPWWDDLSVGAVGTNPAGQVLWQAQGSPGSQTLTVQWTNVSAYFSTTSGQPKILNFQVILYEGTNIIEFRYGSISGATTNTAESASIGIEDATGGPNHYIDAVTGSGVTNNGMGNDNKWLAPFLRFTPGSPSPLAGGTYNVGAGQTYPTLSEAVADLNHRGVSGAVTLSLVDASYPSTTNIYPVLIGPVAGTSAVNTVTIRPPAGTATITCDGSPAGNCGNAASTTAIGTTNEPVIGVVGGDYIQTELISLSLVGTSVADRGLLIANSSASDGAQNNLFQNISITLSRTNTSSVGIQQNVLTAPTAASGANSGNHYYNLTVTNSFVGLQLTGNATFPDLATEVGTSGGGSTVIGDAAANDIGNGSGATWGIRATAQSGVRIFNCEVRNVTGTGTSTVDGIWLDNSGSSTTSMGTCEISGNAVHDVNSTSTSATAHRVTGIRVNLTAAATSASRVFNNFVYALGNSSTNTTARQVVGIFAQEAGSGAGATHNIDFNSVRLEPAVLNSPNSAFEIGTASGPVMLVRDNVFANFTGAQAGSAKHYTWVTPGSTIGPAGSVSDNNDLYVSNATNGFIGLAGGLDQAALGNWQAAVSQDLSSRSGDPQFQSATDLHINAAIPTPVESTGSYFAGAITWVPADKDGQARNVSTPDIGADEGSFTPLFTNNISATLFIDPTNGATRVRGVAFSPQAQFTNAGITNQTNVPVRYRIEGPSPATTEVYNDAQVIAALNAGNSTAVTFSSVTISTDGVYTIYARAENPGDQFPGDDQIVGTLNVFGALSGNYDIGASQAAPFNTLTGAVNRLNAVGVSAAVTFTLIDATYPAETFPISINAFPGASATSTLTIKPSPLAAGPTAGQVTISGSSATAVIKLNGADFVTIDGSNNGTTSRDLTITNTSPSAATAAVWLSSLGAGAGCTDNVIKNCNLSCGVDQTTSSNETFALIMSGGAISTTVDGGEDNDNNTFLNNSITKCRWGIYLRGFSANLNDFNHALYNVVGPAAFGPDQVAKGGIILQNQQAAEVARNEIRHIGNQITDTAAGTDRVGIGVGGNGWAPTASAANTCVISQNLIHDIVDQKTFSAVGIVVAGTGGPSGNLIDNNMIYNISANGTAGDQALGIGIAAGDGDRIIYNSISLSGDMDPASTTTATQSAAGIRISSTNALNLTLKDNIAAVNVTSNTATLKHYSIVAPSTAFAWGTGGSDNNDLWADGSNSQMVLGGIGTTVPYTGVTTLAAWRAQFTPNQDLASVSAAPPFTSATDLHLLTNVPTPLESGGTPIPGVGYDFDQDTRDATKPDIGADEGNFMPLIANDVAAVAFIDPVAGGAKILGAPFVPRATFENRGSANQTNVVVRFVITGPNPSPAQVYNDTTSFASLLAGSGPQAAGFPSATIVTAGTYTMYARAELPGDENTSNDLITATFDVLAPLAGTYPVGASQAPPFNTLTSAVARLMQVGISGNVIFELIDATYTTPAETFPIVIGSYPGENPLYRVTLRPSPLAASPQAGQVTITGSSPSAILVLNGADYVVIDGSNNGTSSRDLTVVNTNAGTASAVVWGQTATGPDGATDNVIKNTNLVGNSNTTTLVGVGFGSSTISTTSNGSGNNSNTIENCNISKTQYGIFSAGSSALAKNTDNVISKNLINTSSPNNVSIGGIMVRFEDQIVISENRVGEVSRASGTAFGISLGFQASTNLINISTGDEVTNATVAGNRVATILSPSTTGFSAVGICAGFATSGTNTIVNNMVSGVTSPATPSDMVAGIYVRPGAGSTTNIWFNSVSLTGNRGAIGATNPSLALAIAGADPVVDIRDNILSNTQYTSNSGKSYAVGLTYSTYASLTSDHNDLFASGPSAAFAVVGGFTNTPAGDRTTLAAWQTETGKDAASISANPLFVSDNDLHITSPLSPAANIGVPLPGITIDIDGEAGNRTTTPDLGADEFTPVPQVLTINDVIVDEGQYPNLTPAPFTIRLTPPSADTVRVSYVTLHQTTNDSDYVVVAVPQLVTLAPGDTERVVTISVIGDALIEPDELYQVILFGAVNATVADSVGQGTIRNDDTVSGVEENRIPVVTYLGANYPNPFSQRTTVVFGLHEAGPVRIQVFDVRGRLVRNLKNDRIEASNQEIAWDGRDDAGQRLASGFYILRMEAGRKFYTRSIRLVK